jgi:hypothetical protein
MGRRRRLGPHTHTYNHQEKVTARTHQKGKGGWLVATGIAPPHPSRGWGGGGLSRRFSTESGRGITRVLTHAFQLHDKAYDGISCTLGEGCMDRPPRHKSRPAGSLSSSQPVGPPRRVVSLAFGLIGFGFLTESWA